MSCYHPLTAYRQDDGSVSFRETGRTHSTLSLPCGQCIGCRLKRARDWGTRIMHEASMHEFNSFVTLTYDDAHLPPLGGLRYSDFQKFMKRVRKRFGPTRFFMCGEYGEEFKRPHYHAGLFGVGFVEDRVFFRNAGPNKVWRSATLEKLWPFGKCEFGSLTTQSAEYMARYALAKLHGDMADAEYGRIDAASGEWTRVARPFCRMSLRPGIGKAWFEKYGREVFPADRVVLGGRDRSVPRYYDVLYDRAAAIAAEEVKYQRVLRAKEHAEDCTDERLAVREQVDKARVSLSRRKL